MTEPDGYADQPVSVFLDALAGRSAAPAGGSAAALALAQAAALCAKTARLSARQLTADLANELTAQAERSTATAASLIDEDARAYRLVIEQSRRAAAARTEARSTEGKPGAAADLDQQVDNLVAALSRAADVPMRLVELAAPVADLAASLSANGNPALRGDAITAALLAQAAARCAATLISINLADAPADTRPARAFDLLAQIAHSVIRAVS